jgi:hypothetical protein
MSTASKKIPLDSWRSKWENYTDPPDDRDREREATFLRSHWTYGALVHSVAADALIEALNGKPDPERQHALFLKLFAEYVNALESLGAWGWSIRNRRTFRLLLDGFLSYPIKAPEEFYCSVLDEGQGASLVALLELPPRQTIIRAIRDLSPDVTSRIAGETLDEVARELWSCADQYLLDDRVVVTNYNKAKHGATMLRLVDHTTGAADFQVIAPQLIVSEINAGKWYQVAKMSVTEEMIDRTRGNIEHATALIRNLSWLAWAMHEAGLL